MNAVEFVQSVIDSKNGFIPEKTSIFDYYRRTVHFKGVLTTGEPFSFTMTDREEIKSFFKLFNSNFRKGMY